MKKNLLLLLTLVAVSGSISATENNSQNASEPSVNPETIKFTEEEYNLLNNIAKYLQYINRVTHDDILLKRSCGWGLFEQPESYDPKEYPDCAEVLTHLKNYKNKQEKLEAELEELKEKLAAESKELIKKIYKDKKAK